MRKFASIILVLALCLCLQVQAFAAPSIITTPATGYTCAEDVEHKIIDGIVVNWGARGETCSFLSPSALNYYYALDTDTWEELSQKDGGTGTSNAYTSELYKALRQLMTLRHTNIQGYQATRPYYMYTDCANNDQTLISSFYSGKTVASTWNGQSYNREHVWPRSKCISTDKTNDSADIMMLRATISSENSSRGNSAYGESSGYFDPGAAVRGDCARMVLYGYVRWGNTGKMWGSSGVMENLDILLKWMEEDPVDTWEMGRNDSVQSITGVRNVFVDYPEFAWMLFGRDIPENMATPSGNAAAAPHEHSYSISDSAAATCTTDGYTTYTCDCGDSYTDSIPATGHTYQSNVTAPTCTAQGYTTHICHCGHNYTDHDTAALGHQWDTGVVTQEPTETTPGLLVYNCKRCAQTKTEAIAPLGHTHQYTAVITAPTCTEDGYTTYTCTCGNSYTADPVAAIGHSFGAWYTVTAATCTAEGLQQQDCAHCDSFETQTTAAIGHSWDAGVVTQAPTETANGELLRTCTNCGQTQTESIPALEHTHNYTTTVTAPTCTEPGYTTYTCSCGEQYTDDSVNALGHRYESVITAPTCTTQGFTTHTCACGDSYVDSQTEALGHTNTAIRDQKEANCAEEGYSGDTYCLACGQKTQSGQTVPATGVHKFSDWVSSEQLRCRTCIVCSFEEVEHFDTPSTTQPGSKPVMPQGDTGWLNILVVSVVVTAFLGAAVYIVKGKRK